MKKRRTFLAVLGEGGDDEGRCRRSCNVFCNEKCPSLSLRAVSLRAKAMSV
jgi:hypothetical protein